MKKSLRNMLIMLAVLLVLGGGAAALVLLPQGGEEEPAPSSSESSREATVLVSVERGDVAAISVKNPVDSFTMIPDGDEDFTLQGYEDSVVNHLTVNNSVIGLTALASARDLGPQSDLAAFGLAGEEATQVEIRQRDGAVTSLVLGFSAAETSGRYVLQDGQVYICPGIPENLFGSKFRYFTSSLYTISSNVSEDNPNGYDILYHLRLSGANYPQPIEIVYDTSYLGQYLLETPILAESGTSAMKEILNALLAPTASEVVAAKLTPEDLEAFGLAEPAARVEFDLNNHQHTMAVSANKSGVRYLLLDDRDAVYQVQDDVVAPWASASLLQLRMSYIWLANIADVETLTVTRDGDEVTQFHVTRTVNQEKSTEDSLTYDLAVTDGSGRAVDYKDYQRFYADLIAVAVLNVDPAEAEGVPAYRVEYRFFDGGTDTVEFVPLGSDRYAALLNGSYSGQVRRSETDAVFAGMPQG